MLCSAGEAIRRKLGATPALSIVAAVSAAVFALGGCAHRLDPDGALTVVPYTLQNNGRIVIEAGIGESGALAFALDTAASISFVSDGVRERLSLATVPGVAADIYGLLASGRFPLVHIDELRIGSEIWRDANLVSIPATTPATRTLDGVLGIDFLRRYAVGFSPQDRVVRLYSPEVVSRRAYRGWASVPLQPRRISEVQEPLYFFDVRIGGQLVPALFDLGAGLNMLNTAGARRFGLTEQGGDGLSVLSGGLQTTSILVRFASEPLMTGGIRWSNEVFYIGDPDIFAMLSYADRPLAILGSGLFNQREFVIDFARNRLLVRTSMAEIETPMSP